MTSPERLIAEYDMLPEGRPVLCAVSGGADSICLLHWLAARGVQVAAAHYNHMLRGAAADRDAAFVAAQCRALGVPLYSGGGDVASAAAAQGRGVEETARDMRYDFLHQTARRMGAARIATAHTADDNLETMLLHLARGSATRGMAGIPPRRGILVRPFLETTRTQLLAWLAAREIPFVQDESNEDGQYARNRVRAGAVPVLRGVNPNAVENAAATARILRAEDRYLDELARTCDLATAAEPLALRRVAQLLRQAGQCRYTAAHLRAVLALARGADPSAMVHLPGGLVAARAYDSLVFTTRPDDGGAPQAVPIPGDGTYFFGPWRVAVQCGICDGKPEKKSDTFWLDCDKIVGGMVLRTRTRGDAICLPGRRTKTIKRLFIDERVPRMQRAGRAILADTRGVLAVAGFGPEASCLAAPGVRAWQVTIETWGEACAPVQFSVERNG